MIVFLLASGFRLVKEKKMVFDKNTQWFTTLFSVPTADHRLNAQVLGKSCGECAKSQADMYRVYAVALSTACNYYFYSSSGILTFESILLYK